MTTRVRLRYAKLGKLRWTSHRDLARVWERTLRRAGVPVAYSVGFSPRPRISFGLALPTGAESRAEYLDLDMEDDDAGGPGREPAHLPELLNPHLPDGMAVTGAAAVSPTEASLQHDVVACRWELVVPPPAAGSALTRSVTELLRAESLVVTRQRKGQDVTDDIRPSILAVSIEPAAQGAGPTLVADLATQPRGLRPAELLDALGIDPAEARMLRTHQWIERDGARREPLPATDAPHAERRAS